MAETANIALNDSAPAARTFKPTWRDGLLANWSEQTLSTAALYPTLSIGMRAPKASQPRKVTIKLVVPVEVVSGDLTTYESVSVFMDVIVSQNASATNIADALAYLADIPGNAIIDDVITYGNFPY